MRIILFTGKGGVGKTTLAAATGVLCAERGLRTVVLSTDAAHSLADSLDAELGNDPAEVAPNLHAGEINVHEELKAHWGLIRAFIKRNLVRIAGFSGVIAEEFAVFPGMEELFCLLKVKLLAQDESYDVVLVDCAPTGATVRMLSFPDVAKWYMEKVFHIERAVVRMIRPVVNRIAPFELPADDVFGSIEQLYAKLDGVKDIFGDPAVTSVRLVMNPEKMVIRESQRAYAYLNLFGFPVDACLINRVIPPEGCEGYFSGWGKVQQKYLGEIESGFAGLPQLRAGFREEEVVGLDALRAVGRELYGDTDPSSVLLKQKPVSIYQEDGRYVLSMRLPFVTKDKLGVWVRGDELVVRVNNFKRNLMLPNALASRGLHEARMEHDLLKVYFGGETDGSE